MKKKKLLFWGYFWRYGIILLTIILPLVIGIILKNIKVAEKYAESSFFFLMGIGLLAMGIDYILAIILKMPHILLVCQSAYHGKMNPDNLDWENIDKNEFIMIGIMLVVLGILFEVITINKLMAVL